MSEILKTMGQIAGIGGLALGVFLIILWNFLDKDRFVNLKKDHAFKLYRMILVLLFLITIVGMSGWFYMESLPPARQAPDPTLLAEFVLDEKGDPSFDPRDDGLNQYQVRVSVGNVGPDIQYIVYDLNSPTFEDPTLQSYDGPKFEKVISTYGDLDIKLRLGMSGTESITNTKSLKDALSLSYARNQKPEIDKALEQIRKN